MSCSKKTCLWCNEPIQRTEYDYRFCSDCLENLEELEAVTDRCNLTDLAEVIFQQIS